MLRDSCARLNEDVDKFKKMEQSLNDTEDELDKDDAYVAKLERKLDASNAIVEKWKEHCKTQKETYDEENAEEINKYLENIQQYRDARHNLLEELQQERGLLAVKVQEIEALTKERVETSDLLKEQATTIQSLTAESILARNVANTQIELCLYTLQAQIDKDVDPPQARGKTDVSPLVQRAPAARDIRGVSPDFLAEVRVGAREKRVDDAYLSLLIYFFLSLLPASTL